MGKDNKKKKKKKKKRGGSPDKDKVRKELEGVDEGDKFLGHLAKKQKKKRDAGKSAVRAGKG